MEVEIFTDGASRGNPGPAGIGAVIKQNDQVIKEISEYIGRSTNNVAEYTAFIKALEEALLLGARKAVVKTDSELLVKQINGEYRVKNEGLKPLHFLAKDLVSRFKSCHVQHVPREKNQQADDLANAALDNRQKKDMPLFGH
ncbi:MAG: ribonuclease HI family protein [Candidatus Margulisbacteria bacterium]|nr:ribonuclease HI family protein [Candidatus Margulisiibacteriota bacterium]